MVASGLSVGSGFGAASAGTTTDEAAEEAFVIAVSVGAGAEAGAAAGGATATGRVAEEAFAAAVSLRAGGSGAVIRPARNPIPMKKAASAARMAQGERWLRKGELVSEYGSSAATTRGNATIGGVATIGGGATIGGDAMIGGDSAIGGDSTIGGA